MTIVEFIETGLGEDEARARAHVPIDGVLHRHGTSEPGWVEHNHLGGGTAHGHDPETGGQVEIAECSESARVLREVKAKRAILTAIFDYEARIDAEWGCGHNADEIRAGQCTDAQLEDLGVLRHLADVYSDRPGYESRWRL